MSEAEAWEKWSLPLGNGYFGANVFGRTDTERIQLTEKSLSNPYGIGGLNNFSETYLDFGHTTVENYERGLLLNEAFAYVKRLRGRSLRAHIFYQLSRSGHGSLLDRLQARRPFLYPAPHNSLCAGL